jgi:hypothetical protein
VFAGRLIRKTFSAYQLFAPCVILARPVQRGLQHPDASKKGVAGQSDRPRPSSGCTAEGGKRPNPICPLFDAGHAHLVPRVPPSSRVVFGCGDDRLLDERWERSPLSLDVPARRGSTASSW